MYQVSRVRVVRKLVLDVVEEAVCVVDPTSRQCHQSSTTVCMAVESEQSEIGMQTAAKPTHSDSAVRIQSSSEEREEEPEEDGEEDSEFIDEECDESGERRSKAGSTTGRVVTLQMLLAADILQPGEATMSIEYLGQRFMGDLLPDGKIKSVETDIVFASPSAWAIHCKRIINPEKKSGCGWASVRYKGKKLEIYKTKYFKKRTLDQNKENEATDEEEMELKTAPVQVPSPNPVPRMIVKHSILGNRSTLHDGNTLVESTPFSAIGKLQPFLVSLSTNAALVMDFHCHLTTSQVVGYLAGHWDVNAHNLAVTHAFPCRCRLSDKESAPLVEAEICKGLEQRRLTLVGWYHSHPYAPATPTLRDIDSQLDYEIRMKGSSDASYTPCIGFICSPYNKESLSLESTMMSYWVMPPPENKPHEYGKPMMMSYSVVQDNYLSQDALAEMKRCADFYKVDQDYLNFSDNYKNGITYLEKLKSTLSSKFPRDQASGGTLWNYLSELVCTGSTGETQPPPVQKNPPVPAMSAPTPLLLPISIPSTNKQQSLLGAELASALFASGKFPSPASLMSLSAIFPTQINCNSSSASVSSPLSILKPSHSLAHQSHVNSTHHSMNMNMNMHHSMNMNMNMNMHMNSLTSHALQLVSHNHNSLSSHSNVSSSHSHSVMSHTTQSHTSHGTQSILSLSPLPPLSTHSTHTHSILSSHTNTASTATSTSTSTTQAALPILSIPPPQPTCNNSAQTRNSPTPPPPPPPPQLPPPPLPPPPASSPSQSRTSPSPPVTTSPQPISSLSSSPPALPPPSLAPPPPPLPPPPQPPSPSSSPSPSPSPSLSQPTPAKVPKLDEPPVTNGESVSTVTDNQPDS